MLKVSWSVVDFLDYCYVEKFIYGWIGDNVCLFDGSLQFIVENDGDYGDLLCIYQ